MAHNPQHPDNPYNPQLPEAEQTPAKIWELLRRNDTFKKAVARLVELDNRVKAAERKIQHFRSLGFGPGQPTPESREFEAECRRRSETNFLAGGMLRNLGRTHPFAAAALQWLVPEPWFEIRHEIIHPDVDLTQTHFPPTWVVRLESGSTPDPSDKSNWQEFTSHGRFDAESARNHAGCAPMVRGPYLSFTIAEDGRLQESRINPIKEWQEYQDSHGSFSRADTWRSAPTGFKREFCWLWRQCDSREKNPITGCRTDAPQEQETNFFQNWRLMEALSRTVKTGQLKADDYVRSLSFDNLAENYRVFAFPKSIRSRTEARRVAEWLFERLCILSDGTGLPKREPEILGSPLQWDIFLTVRDLVREGSPFEEALMGSFDKIHLRDADWKEGQPMPDQKKRWGQRGPDWKDNYRVMDSPLTGEGLLQRVFPRVPPLSLPATQIADS